MWTIHENRQKLSILVLFWHFFEIFGKPLSGSSGRKQHLKGLGAIMSEGNPLLNYLEFALFLMILAHCKQRCGISSTSIQMFFLRQTDVRYTI